MTLLKLGVMTFARGKDTWYNEGSSTQVSGLFFMFFFTAPLWAVRSSTNQYILPVGKYCSSG